MKLAAKLGLLVLIMLASVQMMAQRTVTGTVVDESGVPLIGVNVIIEGSTSGMVTDLDGAYSLKVPGEDAVLVFSYIGMLPRYEKVGSRQVIDVQMQEDAQSLDEVIVTGYALQRSRDITGAVETISLEDEPIAPVSTTGQMLQGKLAGVRVNQTSGRPGQGLQFQIRGAFSLTAGSDPLYVVDGMPLSGDISAINPNEIENITVLKDPAAASLYGSRAANGVVLITTKSTKPGQTKIDFNAYYGYEDIPQGRRLDMMNAREYAQFQKEIAESNGRPVDPTFQNPEEYGEGTDWFEEITRRGAIQSYNLTIGTGTEKFNVTTTAGYFNQEGVVVGTSFERLSLRVNTRYQPFERLRIGLNVAPTRTFNTNFNTDGWPYITENLVSSALLTTPLADPYNPDGSLALTASDPATFGNPNWLRVAHDKVYEDKNFQLLSNAFLEWEIVDGLTAKTTASVQTGSRNLFQFNPSTIGVLFIPPPSIPSGSDNNVQFYNWLNENTLNYRKEVGSHNFDLLAGFTSQQFRSEGTLVEGINYPDDKIQSVNAAGQTLVTSNIQEWTLLSYLARFNYNYGGKYLFTASIRRDGSSRFGADNRWGNFPAVSAGWVVSEENFWNIEPISFLKLRGSYGITGNFEIGNFTHLSTLGNVFYPFGGSTVSGRAPNNLGDQQLGWEDNVQFNIGADLHLFNDRIQLSYNYYSRRAQDLLFNVEVPVSSGFSNIQTNIGELKFWGHEFSLFASVASSRDFSWDANFNISFDRNRTESLGTQGGSLPSGILLYQFRSNISNVGEPIAQFFGAIHDGVYVNQADFDSSPKHVSSQVGTVKFRDLNGDGIITFPEDMTVIGSPWPDFVYGMTNNIRFKNLNLSFAIAGSFGNDILAFYENWTANLDGVFNVLSEVQDRWKSEAEPGAGLYGSTQQGTTFLERDRQAVKDNLKGQAFFLRALAYFDLVNNFGGVPLFLEAPKSYDETFKPRASAGDIYDQVIADATEAAGLLPGKDSQSPGRATRGAASTLLADAYMTLKRWGEAEAVLKEVQGMGYSLLPEYADIFRPANEGNSEIIFEVDYIEGTAFSLESVFPYDFLPELEDITVITGSSPPQRGGGAFNIPTPELLASYEDTLLDKRYAASIGRYTGPSPLPGVEYVSTPYCRKYLHPHTITGQTGQNWIVYRYADVLLMLAECLNEQGKAGEALPLLNQVRMRAGLGDSSASGQDGVREAILSERRVELAFENKRWKDLIRNGTAVAVVNAFGAKVKANPQDYYYPAGSAPFPNSFQVDANRLIYPIPVSEIIINPELSQNLGY